MVQVNHSDIKLEKIREKMQNDPLFDGRDIRHASDVYCCLEDSYLHQDRDKEIVKLTIKELIDRGFLPQSIIQEVQR